MSRDQRAPRKRVLHFLNEDGMVACNPRDREAAHRAEEEEIGTYFAQAVTCPKCWQVIGRSGVLRPDRGATHKSSGQEGWSDRDEPDDW